MTRKKTYSIIYLLIFIFAGALFSSECYGVPSAPFLYELKQTDGAVFNARQWGDEWSHGWQTEEGYSIVFDEGIGKWTYATTGPDGRLQGSSKVVGRDLPPSGIPKYLRPTARAKEEIDSRRSASSTERTSGKVVPPAGTAKVPVLLINFNDTSTSYTAPSFETLLFGTGNGSMKDYYGEVSYGAFSVSSGPSGIAGWFTASGTHNYYGQNIEGYDAYPATLVIEAVTQADAGGFDFAPYDQDGDCYVDVVNIVHQGSGEEAGGPSTDIWSHSWDLNSAQSSGDGTGIYTTNDDCTANPPVKVKVNDYVIQPETLYGSQQTIGVFAHEFGHALGLPDLYDTDGSSEGIGDWSLMAGGSWNYVSWPGDSPAHMDAWSKYFLAWVTPTGVSGALPNEQIDAASSAPDVYKFLSGTTLSGEYFLIENRQQSGFDAGLPGSGLLVWHIDGNTIASRMSSKTVNNYECWPGGTSCATNHYGVKLVQADNHWELERGYNRGEPRDPFPGTLMKTSFTGSTSPNSNLYNGSQSGVSVTSISASGISMTATLSASGGGSTFSASGSVKTGSAIGISGVSLTFTRVSGSGALPSSVLSDSSGNWSQSGFQSGTAYRVTPSKTGYIFTPAYRDFSSGSSGLNFTGSTPTGITVTTPNGGDNWQAGTTQTIEWSYIGSPGTYVRIELYKRGSLNRRIVSSTPIGGGGVGSYMWTIPASQTPGADYTMKISSTASKSYSDTSDGNFTISSPSSTPSITVTTPNGGESWQSGTTHAIQWSYSGDPGTFVKIELYKGGLLDSAITASVSIGSGGAGSYNWPIPAPQADGNDYQVRVTSTTNPSYTDISNGNFTISSAPPSTGITVVSPNGGEKWALGSRQTIRWSYTGDPGSYVKIELLKGGVLNRVLISNTSIGSGGAGSFGWTVPYTQTMGINYTIRLTSTTNPSFTDTSNGDFTIGR
jgi:M6 family metalloprotease-like protein